ncbi:hypothetical protein CC78DRAFT_502567 [Lojkania enalia]|uniref:ZW10 C-terminal helical domain-containing protein n=1 Tax=Lojkania enalia TaxID=147567 RepID=A0A9P4N2K1_9PLEO|nr:hypothetical protein CC78DRAFT_502567 [Didymosphaeria enalia]
MPSKASIQELGDAVLQSVEYGSFPQSEDVASANVPPEALPKLLEVVNTAREDTKNEIRKVSRESASDVDGWIAQARKLQDDIKRSQETAHEIVQQAEAGKDHMARVQDAASKLSFLYSEIAYNENLVQVVEQLRDIFTLLESAHEAAVHGYVMHALGRLGETNSALKRLGPFGNTRIVGILKSRAGQLTSAIAENTTELWNALIVVDANENRIILKDEVERETTINIKTVVEALEKLGQLDTFISRLSRSFDDIVLSPRLMIASDQEVSSIKIERDDIQVKGPITDMSVKATLLDIHAIAEYLSTRLPPSIAVPLSAKLIPIIASRLISNWLLPAVPISLDEVPEFYRTLSLVHGLAEYFDELEWSGQSRLRDFIDKSGDIWLTKRKEFAIARVRSVFPRHVQEKNTVERVETQMVSKGDAMLSGQEEQDEDWGAEWGDEEEAVKEAAAPPAPEVEEEDMSAWGMDDDEPPEELKKQPTSNAQGVDEQDEDWGADWGDDEEIKPALAPPASKPAEQSKSNGSAAKPQKPAAEQEVTLRETYTVTAIPESIMEIIMQVVSDVATINKADALGSAIAPASGGLYTIPSQIMAMYRATATTYYSKDIAGDMLIYNDCLRLADRLRTFIHELAEADKTSSLSQDLRPFIRLKLDGDIQAIEGFGKRAYGREMEQQRTIVRDMLEGANGFQGSTTGHLAAECDNAIAMSIDRIAEVKRQWQGILSHSALLQSLGSLVSTAITKFINDVEEMTDIAEDESRKLHGYCTSLSSLSSLFQTEDENGEIRDTTHMYARNWLKFQYLREILDSSLVDIKFMWTESELRYEMDADEVVDLITALFAESDHRRKAIAEIRRLSRS